MDLSDIQGSDIMIFDVEEQNILIESKYFLYMFSIDYINDGFFVDIYDKSTESYVLEEHEIEGELRKIIFENINKEPGTIFRKGNVKFLVRNHDKIIWCDEVEYGRGIASNYISDDNPYDTRNTSSVPMLSRIMPILKEAWIKI